MMTIIDILAVGAGSGLGGMSRFLLSSLLNESGNKGFPAGTLTVNLVGCLILGILYGVLDRHFHLEGWLKLFLTVGFCGGFTTFSTFVNESFFMTSNGQLLSSILYIMASLVGGLLLLYAGYKL